jgi:hypothetical protein
MSMHPLGTSGLRKRTRADELLELASGGPRARPCNQTSPSCSNSLATCSDNPPVLAFLKLLKSRMAAKETDHAGVDYHEYASSATDSDGADRRPRAS